MNRRASKMCKEAVIECKYGRESCKSDVKYVCKLRIFYFYELDAVQLRGLEYLRGHAVA